MSSIRQHSPHTAAKSRALALLWPLSVFAFLLVIYLCTLEPGVGGSSDAVKFQFLGWDLGTAHEPGYPLYLLLSHAFTRWLPLGSAAFMANLLSALLAAAACALLAMATHRLGASRPVAMVAGLGFGLTATFWHYATVAEGLCPARRGLCLDPGAAAALAAAAAIDRPDSRLRRARGGPRPPHDGGLLAAGDGAVVVCAVDRQALWRWRVIAAVGGWLAIGLSFYGYLVWRTYAGADSHLDSTAADLRELLDTALGGRNRGFLSRPSIAELISERVPWLAGALVGELQLFAPFAVLGLLRRWRKFDLLLLGAVAGNLLFLSLYSVGDLEAYLPPAVMVAVIYAALGIDRLLAAARQPRKARWLLLLMLPISLLLINWRSCDRRQRPRPTEAGQILELAADPSLILALEPELATRLQYASRVDPKWGDRQVLQMPWPAPFTPFGFEDIRGYLCDGRRFRLPPRGRLVPAELPVLLTGSSRDHRLALGARGFVFDHLGHNTHRVATDCESPRLPLVAIVHRLISRANLVAAVPTLTDPTFDATRQTVILGQRDIRHPKPSQLAQVRVEAWTQDRGPLSSAQRDPRLASGLRPPAFLLASRSQRSACSQLPSQRHPPGGSDSGRAKRGGMDRCGRER